jgi:MFS family permease
MKPAARNTEETKIMSAKYVTDAGGKVSNDTWLPMVVIALAQMLMSFNVSSIPVSMSGMVSSFNTPPTTVGTAVVMYSLAVSGFVMLGAKLAQRLGAKRFFQIAVSLFLVAMVLMVASPTAGLMLAAQGLAGLAGAALVPTLVALIADHYRGRQQEKAVGWLGSARAIAGVLAFVVVGYVARINWRLAFGLLVVQAAAILALSFKLKPSVGIREVKVDGIGVVLSAVGIILITFGFNNLRDWGVFLAEPKAPFSILGVSPAPAMITIGAAMVMGFFSWSGRTAKAGRTPLLALEVVDSSKEWAAVVTLFVIVATEGAINFAVPLYIQIVQGRSSAATSVAMMPFLLMVFLAAILVVRLYDRFSPRQIARAAFLFVIAGTLWLSFVIHNDWSVFPVIFGLFMVGLGQGALVTLLFNVLVTSSPKQLAGDVGSLRGVTQNLAAAVGTAVMAALVVGVLSAGVLSQVKDNPLITSEMKGEVDLDSINFLSNDKLKARFENTNATPGQITEALRINSETRLRALKTGFLLLAGLSVLALVPCGWLPDYRPGEIRAESLSESNRRQRAA